MKIIKRILLFTMISILGVTLVGCGKKEITMDGLKSATSIEQWKTEYFSNKVTALKKYYETNPENPYKIEEYMKISTMEKKIYGNILSYIKECGADIEIKLTNSKSPTSSDIKAINRAAQNGTLTKELTPEETGRIKTFIKEVEKYISDLSLDEKRAKTDVKSFSKVLSSKTPSADSVKYAKEIFTLTSSSLAESVKNNAVEALNSTMPTTTKLNASANQITDLMKLSSVTGVKIDSKIASELNEYESKLRSKYTSLSKEKEAKKKADAENKKKEDAAKKKSEGVTIGMTPEQVRASMWGNPDKINRTTTAYGVREQWVYRSKWSGYLYFENGRLVTIQN